MLAGSDKALSPIGGNGIDKIADALRLTDVRVELLDGDIYVHGRR
jgi:riboflavin biosynthesis pyrimidine reductase